MNNPNEASTIMNLSERHKKRIRCVKTGNCAGKHAIVVASAGKH